VNNRYGFSQIIIIFLMASNFNFYINQPASLNQSYKKIH